MDKEPVEIYEVEQGELKGVVLWSLRMMLRTIKPWKISDATAEKSQAYVQGWNDCVKEMKKNGDKYIAQLNEVL